MFSSRTLSWTAAAWWLSLSTVTAQNSITPEAGTRVINTVSVTASEKMPGATMVAMGCFNSIAGMTWSSNYNFMSSAQCQVDCVNKGLGVIGLSGGFDCYCGNTVPPASAKLDDSSCNVICAGFGAESCGGLNSTSGVPVLKIYNDQLNPVVSSLADSTTSSSAAAAAAAATTTSVKASTSQAPAVTAAPSVVTIIANGSPTTVFAANTASATSATTSSPSTGSGGPSTAGIAAGVVVGLIAVAAIIGGLFLYIRQKKRREIEEEHKRQVATDAFIANKPGTPGSNSIPDMRLDPAILRDRRMSDGSIMDNQDYSRRILKVTNA